VLHRRYSFPPSGWRPNSCAVSLRPWISSLRTAVAELPDEDFARPSGCTGWLVRDLVCHLIIDAQDVLITRVTPAEAEPTRDTVTYWNIVEAPTGDDPLDALIVRLATAYEEPRLLKFHFDDVGTAAELADPTVRVGTRGEVLTARDYLTTELSNKIWQKISLLPRT
jgi:Mycothiol maleylpyruvate isomerase N-terminal domain